MLEFARADPDFRRRFMAADADPDDPQVAAAVAAGLREVHERCVRLGAPMPR